MATHCQLGRYPQSFSDTFSAILTFPAVLAPRSPQIKKRRESATCPHRQQQQQHYSNLSRREQLSDTNEDEGRRVNNRPILSVLGLLCRLLCRARAVASFKAPEKTSGRRLR
ncbi:Hypothetical protein NTJ_00541 [Nesidiocoris tenuis]|uniref:Uncharacterized protein n=1 Tax=Nesidiocoris tenuis TaxID=355587 RepID=A0ABN7AA25_9HEMI|nr:Hypothetical protein NTJ_00541 [Nesidiocoris tenuis]